MIGEELLLLGIPLTAFVASVFAAYWLMKWRNTAILICLGLVWVAFTGMMFFGMEAATGWDGLGYLLGLLGISAPIGVAGLIGSTVGWFKREKAMHA